MRIYLYYTKIQAMKADFSANVWVLVTAEQS